LRGGVFQFVDGFAPIPHDSLFLVVVGGGWYLFSFWVGLVGDDGDEFEFELLADWVVFLSDLQFVYVFHDGLYERVLFGDVVDDVVDLFEEQSQYVLVCLREVVADKQK
jgi:hypothetical protein